MAVSERRWSGPGFRAHGAPVVPAPFLGEWVLLSILFTTGAWFALGFARVWRASTSGRAALQRQGFLFAAAWLVIAASLLSPLHRLGGQSFAAHMIEHELLMLVAAPLFAFARPLGLFVWALPARTRTSLRYLAHRSWFASAWRTLSSPLSATLIQAAMLWIWHTPQLFNRALISEGWHAAQHLSIVFSAILFWWAIDLAARRGRAGASGFLLFITSMQGGLLGALMAFSASPWYERYASLGLIGTAGLTPLEDQQIAGLIMWIPGGAVHMAAALWYLRCWLTPPEQPLGGAAK